MSGLIYDAIERYTDRFYKPLNEDFEKLRRFGEENHFAIITRDTENFLLSLLAVKRPESILEIGSSIGYSASLFAKFCGARVDTIERDSERARAAINNFEELGLGGLVRLYEGEACEILKGFAEEKRSYGFVFIDAAKSHYREFWDACMSLVHSGSIVVCDDVLFKGLVASEPELPKRKHRTNVLKLREFLSYIHAFEGADTRLFAVGDGLTVSVIR